MKKQIVVNSIILLCFLGIPMKQVIAQSVTVEMDSTRQLIRGFGGIHINSWQGTQLDENLQEKSFDNDPGEMGLSILRLQINPDSNSFGNELDIARYAASQGAIVFSCPWNPPEEMIDPSSERRRLHEDYYEAYAEHLNRYNTFMADSGISIYAISVQNEPDIGGWAQWTAAEMIKFLEENGGDIDTRVMAPESFQFRKPLTDSVLNDPEASANVDIVVGHIYGGGLEDYPLAREQGKEVWMTEHLTGSDDPADNTWSLALDLGEEINDCMQANFNAYIWWYIRRFYSLITDDGNISKKGYVISQFAKFIRPGAVRVDAAVASASGVDASAFATDSTLVIVVVNSDASAVSLDFTIQNNIGIDTLTQFTTSETKNVVNDGMVAITGGTFSATVDAESVTTFTTIADHGGQFGNIAPVALAGPDIEVDDTNGNGSEIIIFDGSGSTDPDGTITNYSWSLNGMHMAWDSIAELTIDNGVYEVVLTVTDNDGATHSDTLNLSVNSIYSTEIWLEAECGQVGSTWNILSNGDASHGEYITTPGGIERIDSASSDTADHVIFTFHVSEAAPFKVWGRVITPTANDDSYWVKMDDDTTWALWNSIPGGNSWHWDDVHDQANESEVMVYELDTGYHSLSICIREDGTLLDKVCITNTGVVPTGAGDTASNCPEEIIPGFTELNNDATDIKIYPNPAYNEIHIEWNTGFTSLTLVGMDGRILMKKEYPAKMKNTSLHINLERGMYFLFLNNEQTSGIRKLLIE